MIPLKRLFVFAFLFVGGNLLAGVAILMMATANGMTPAEMTTLLTSGEEELPGIFLNTMLWLNGIVIFILPALCFGMIYYCKSIWRYFEVQRIPNWPSVGLAALLLASAYPLVLLSYELNALIPLSDWMQGMEQNAAEILSQLLDMRSVPELLLSLILVAVLPAMGEEFVFRGIVQKQLYERFDNPMKAIWVAAFFFSAVHLQFEGFLPRMLLGAVLGYAYYWTRNLWIPILIHFLNNAIPALALYFVDEDITQVNESRSLVTLAIVTLVSLPILWWVTSQFRRSKPSYDNIDI